MIDKLFEGTAYYDFPSFEVALFSLTLAFVLSGMIAFTYKITFKGKVFPNHFFQAMILSSIVTAMIMMAVGSNLAVGFGIIGAVAIIRFRTLIQDTRNIIFMFAGISVGIAMGVYGYAIGIAGTVMFCAIAFLLNYSFAGTAEQEIKFELTLIFNENEGDIEARLAEQCDDVQFIDMRRAGETGMRFEFEVIPKKGIGYNELYTTLSNLPGIKEARVSQRKPTSLF